MNKLSQFKGFLIGLIFSNSYNSLSKKTTKALGAFEQTKMDLNKVIQLSNKRFQDLKIKREAERQKFLKADGKLANEGNGISLLISRNEKVLENIDKIIG